MIDLLDAEERLREVTNKGAVLLHKVVGRGAQPDHHIFILQFCEQGVRHEKQFIIRDTMLEMARCPEDIFESAFCAALIDIVDARFLK